MYRLIKTNSSSCQKCDLYRKESAMNNGFLTHCTGEIDLNFENFDKYPCVREARKIDFYHALYYKYSKVMEINPKITIL